MNTAVCNWFAGVLKTRDTIAWGGGWYTEIIHGPRRLTTHVSLVLAKCWSGFKPKDLAVWVSLLVGHIGINYWWKLNALY